VRILIVEDEPPIADYIEASVRSILGRSVRQVHISHSLEEALLYLEKQAIDLCLLDLNLSGESGFDILRRAASMPFHAVIISAHSERAVEAFEYGVLDFVPKPFSRERLQRALARCRGRLADGVRTTKYLSYRSGQETRLIPVGEILFLKAVRYLVEAHLVNGSAVLLDKRLHRLELTLPENFLRIHRTYIVNLSSVESYQHTGGSVYRVRLKNGALLPLSRSRVGRLRSVLSA
jgi:DNA-binding LytR/AlgR family response regulator